MTHVGRITWCNVDEGYGFLTCEHEADIFFDIGMRESRSLRSLIPGNWMRFDIVDGELGPTARHPSLILGKRGHMTS